MIHHGRGTVLFAVVVFGTICWGLDPEDVTPLTLDLSTCTPGAKGYHCQTGEACTENEDCRNRVCRAGFCDPPTCVDGISNGNETGVDCGGECSGCVVAEKCFAPHDCESKSCYFGFTDRIWGTCRDNDCEDGVKNGQELDVDCGTFGTGVIDGGCPACGRGRSCTGGDGVDCKEGRCLSNDDYVSRPRFCVGVRPSVTLYPEYKSIAYGGFTIFGINVRDLVAAELEHGIAEALDVEDVAVLLTAIEDVSSGRSYAPDEVVISEQVNPGSSVSVVTPDANGSIVGVPYGSTSRGFPGYYVTTSDYVDQVHVRFQVYAESYEIDLIALRVKNITDLVVVESALDGERVWGFVDFGTGPAIQQGRNLSFPYKYSSVLGGWGMDGASLPAGAVPTRGKRRGAEQRRLAPNAADDGLVRDWEGGGVRGGAGREWVKKASEGQHLMDAWSRLRGLSIVDDDEFGEIAFEWYLIDFLHAAGLADVSGVSTSSLSTRTAGEEQTSFFKPRRADILQEPNGTIFEDLPFPVQPRVVMLDRHGRRVRIYSEPSYAVAYLDPVRFPPLTTEGDDDGGNAFERIRDARDSVQMELFGTVRQRMRAFSDGTAFFTDLSASTESDNLTILFGFESDLEELNSLDVIPAESREFEVIDVPVVIIIPPPRVPLHPAIVAAIVLLGLLLVFAMGRWGVQFARSCAQPKSSSANLKRQKRKRGLGLVFTDQVRHAGNEEEMSEPVYVNEATAGTRAGLAGRSSPSGTSPRAGTPGQLRRHDTRHRHPEAEPATQLKPKPRVVADVNAILPVSGTVAVRSAFAMLGDVAGVADAEPMEVVDPHPRRYEREGAPLPPIEETVPDGVRTWGERYRMMKFAMLHAYCDVLEAVGFDEAAENSRPPAEWWVKEDDIEDDGISEVSSILSSEGSDSEAGSSRRGSARKLSGRLSSRRSGLGPSVSGRRSHRVPTSGRRSPAMGSGRLGSGTRQNSGRSGEFASARSGGSNTGRRSGRKRSGRGSQKMILREDEPELHTVRSIMKGKSARGPGTGRSARQKTVRIADTPSARLENQSNSSVSSSARKERTAWDQAQKQEENEDELDLSTDSSITNKDDDDDDSSSSRSSSDHSDEEPVHEVIIGTGIAVQTNPSSSPTDDTLIEPTTPHGSAAQIKATMASITNLFSRNDEEDQDDDQQQQNIQPSSATEPPEEESDDRSTPTLPGQVGDVLVNPRLGGGSVDLREGSSSVGKP